MELLLLQNQVLMMEALLYSCQNHTLTRLLRQQIIITNKQIERLTSKL